MIKKLFLTIVFIVILAGCDQKPKILDLDGKAINFQDYKGKWVVINYWASWCGHCLKELPEFNKFYDKHKNAVVVLGVNYDQLPAEQLRAMTEKLNIQFPTLVTDPAAVLGIGRVSAIPVTFVMNPEGKISEPMIGEQTVQTLENMTDLKLAVR